MSAGGADVRGGGGQTKSKGQMKNRSSKKSP